MKPHIFNFQNIAYFQACGSYSLVVEDTGKIKVVQDSPDVYGQSDVYPTY
jgi:hypothetical protein